MDQQYEPLISHLYKEYSAAMMRRCYRKFGDWQTAEDLVQELFIIACCKAETLISHQNPVGWLYKTLSNLMLQERNRKIKTHEIPQDDIDMPVNLSMEETDFNEILPEGLSERDAQILRMRFVDELSYMEIGNRLGISVTAAGVRLKRAKDCCRRLLEENNLPPDKG